jgi:GNAT superfamily N-acetyltransferase
MMAEDSFNVAVIHTLAWQFAYKGIVEQNFLNSLDIKKRESSWRHGIEMNVPPIIRLVAEIDGNVIGFATGLENRKAIEMPLCDGELWAIYVHPDYLNKGVGKALLNQFKSEIRTLGRTRMCVWALKENLQARNFYESQGGVLTGVRDVKIGEQILPEVGYEFYL